RGQELAVSAPVDLCQRDCRCAALFVAGEGRYAAPFGLWIPVVDAAGISSAEVRCVEQPVSDPSRLCACRNYNERLWRCDETLVSRAPIAGGDNGLNGERLGSARKS